MKFKPQVISVILSNDGNSVDLTTQAPDLKTCDSFYSLAHAYRFIIW